MKTKSLTPKAGTKSIYFLSLFTMLMGCGLHLISSQTTDSIVDLPKPGRIDAAFANSKGYIYFFSGDEYIKWKPRKGVIPTKDGNVKGEIGITEFKSVTKAFGSEINAVLNDLKYNSTYFLKGDEFIRYGTNYSYYLRENNRESLKNLPASFSKNIDAAIIHPSNKKVYLFKGKKYCVYKPKTYFKNKPEVKIIGKGGWRSLPKMFRSNIDAALVHPTNKKIYFFKDDKYCVWQPGKGVLKPAIRKRGINGWKGVMFD